MKELRTAIAKEMLGERVTEKLCELYESGVRVDHANEEQDDEDLTKICEFESDVGFICAAEAVTEGFSKRKDIRTKTFYQLFDLPNPFEGYLPPERYSTHSWDIVALLGAYDDRLNNEYLGVVREWRSRMTEYCISGKEPWATYQDGKAVYISKDGLDVKDLEMLPGTERRKKLGAIAKDGQGGRGYDLLWEEVCRRWLDKGQ